MRRFKNQPERDDDNFISIMQGQPFSVDKWLNELDVNEVSYNALRQFEMTLDNDQRMEWFREAFRRYFDNHSIIVNSESIEFAMYIKQMESNLDRKTLTLTDVTRKSFVRTKLQLKNDSEIPIKLVWLRLLKHYDYDFDKVIKVISSDYINKN